MTQVGLDREVQLRAWLSTLLGLRPQDIQMEIAAADASFRRYWRVNWLEGMTRIVMDAPPQHEDCKPFVHVTELLRSGGLHAPQCFHQNLEEGFLVLEDLGKTTYADALTLQTGSALYRDALGALVQLQTIPAEGVVPEYSRQRLSDELDLFPVWYLSRHCGLTLSEAEQSEWHIFSEGLLDTLESYPKVLVHRDYHCRNLMACGENNPGILDYQDAVYGPITYDLVSLLKDAYIKWEEEQVLDWMIQYWEKAKKAGLPVAKEVAVFHEQFEWMGLQRHLKIVGIFARLYHRDGKSRYLADLPLVLEYTRKMAQRYSRCGSLLRILDRAEQQQSIKAYTF